MNRLEHVNHSFCLEALDHYADPTEHARAADTTTNDMGEINKFHRGSLHKSVPYPEGEFKPTRPIGVYWIGMVWIKPWIQRRGTTMTILAF